jgi:hypothetical protein
MAVKSTKLGPGTLILGPTGTPQDASCQLQNGVVEWDKDKDDDITVLCGDTVPGGTTYTATLSGTFLQDLEDDTTGLVAWSWANKGTTQDFEFVPNTAAGATVTGKVIVDPIAVGSTEDYGATLTSDFEWDCVGEPVLDWPAAGALAAGGEPAALRQDDEQPVGTG